MKTYTLKQIQQMEGTEILYPMNYRPNANNKYSIFLISDISKSADIETNTSIIDYISTENANWINQKFYHLSLSLQDLEAIKIYYKVSSDSWKYKGCYLLLCAEKTNGIYRYRLAPVNKQN